MAIAIARHEAASERALDALGSPTRRRVLDLLAAGPKSVSELAARLPVSRPAVSQHLAALLAAGLVECEVTGRLHHYSIRSEGFEAATSYLDAFWSEALARFRLVADNLSAERDADGA
ncbi:MAG: metalloregulator ArsR/SmtB family transcription factor [Gemmatimonadota bacterium]